MRGFRSLASFEAGPRVRLWAILDAGAGVVAKDSRLCQSYRTGDYGTGVRMPDKIAAAQLLVKMCGWANPERVELSATDTLAEFIQSIRYLGRTNQADGGVRN